MQETEILMNVSSEGSVRVDLVGGTLDLEPINLIIPGVVTLNVATSLKAKVGLRRIDNDQMVIISEDYNKTYSYESSEFTDKNLYYSDYFKEMSFVLQIVHSFGIKSGLEITLSSGAPAGSGLGGSSAMGITLYKALCKLQGKSIEIEEAVRFVKSIEGRILNRGIPGYQDYYPALLGGVLSLKGSSRGVVAEQLFSADLKQFLEDHVTLVYSGISRNSGINNWDVYKAFFDQNEVVRDALTKIAEISDQTYKAIKEKNFLQLVELIGLEGSLRESLAPGIVPIEVSNLFNSLKNRGLVSGIKMCGAGGGGCFILVHEKKHKQDLNLSLENAKYQVLDFFIDPPLSL